MVSTGKPELCISTHVSDTSSVSPRLGGHSRAQGSCVVGDWELDSSSSIGKGQDWVWQDP